MVHFDLRFAFFITWLRDCDKVANSHNPKLLLWTLSTTKSFELPNWLIWVITRPYMVNMRNKEVIYLSRVRAQEMIAALQWNWSWTKTSHSPSASFNNTWVSDFTTNCRESLFSFQKEHKSLCQWIGKDGPSHPSQAFLDQTHVVTRGFSYFIIHSEGREFSRIEQVGARESFYFSSSEKLASLTGSTKCLVKSWDSGT